MNKRVQMRKFSLYNFPQNRNGLSAIVVNLILVLLGMVAIGVVWAVVNNLLQSGTEQTTTGFEQLSINLELTRVSIDRENISIIIDRKIGEGDLAGIAFSISDGESSKVVKKDASDLGPLGRKTFLITSSEIGNLGVISSISASPILGTNYESGKLGRVISTLTEKDSSQLTLENQWWEITPSTINILIIENSSGTPWWISQMQTLGYHVIINYSITSITELESYISSLPEENKPDIIACIKTGWACNKAPLFNSLYDAGYKIFTNGNDNTPAIKIISTTQYVSAYSRNTTTIYPATEDCAKQLTYNWTSSAGSGPDGRMGVLTIPSSACPIAKDTLASPTFIEAIYMEGTGRWFHIQAHSSMNNNFLDNALKYLAR